MRVIEFLHDIDAPAATNVDIWARESGFKSKKFCVYESQNYPEPDSFDLLIVHGGAQHVYDPESAPWLRSEIVYVKEVLKKNKPVVGICLGAQIIAAALGAKVFKSDEPEIGWFKAEITYDGKRHPVLRGIKDRFMTFFWHYDHYDLPAGCRRLARTSGAENQVFAGDHVPALGFQFHPEYTLKNIMDYYQEFGGEKGRFIQNGEQVKRIVETMTDTYPLFKHLMENARIWFSEKFRIPA